MSIQQRQQVGLGAGAHGLVDGLAALEHQEGGDAHHAKLGGQLRLLIHVDCADFDLSGGFVFQLLQPGRERQTLTYLRNAFASLCVTGPFSILVGYEGGLMALNDRLKLRSMVVGEKDKTVYIASEECAIRVIAPELDRLWAPRGGEAVIVGLEEGGK